MSTFVLRVKRAETPFYAAVKRSARAVLTFNLAVPRIALPLCRGMYHCHFFLARALNRAVSVFYRAPLFRGRCEAIGRRLYLERIPSVSGGVRIRIGDDMTISGALGIGGGRVFDAPELIIGNRVFLGHQVMIAVSRRVVIEDDVLISAGCYIADNSGHPMNAEQRSAGAPPEVDAVRPVRIRRRAWIGMRSIILPGVTIGEGGIVGAGSVVTRDVPPFTTCVGNPCRLVEPVQERQ